MVASALVNMQMSANCYFGMAAQMMQRSGAKLKVLE